MRNYFIFSHLFYLTRVIVAFNEVVQPEAVASFVFREILWGNDGKHNHLNKPRLPL